MSVGSSEVAELFFTNWTNLADTPSTITALQFVRGNAGGTALEFVAANAAITLQNAYDAATPVPQITVANSLPLTIDLTAAANDVFALRDESNNDILRVSDTLATFDIAAIISSNATYDLQIGAGAAQVGGSAGNHVLFVGSDSSSGRVIIQGTTQADLVMTDGGGVVDERVFQVVNAGGDVTLRSLTDAGALLNDFIGLDLATGYVNFGSASRRIQSMQQDDTTGRFGTELWPDDFTITTATGPGGSAFYSSNLRTITTNIPGGGGIGNDTAVSGMNFAHTMRFEDTGFVFAAQLLINAAVQVECATALVGPLYLFLDQYKTYADTVSATCTQHNTIRAQPSWGPNINGGSITQTSAQLFFCATTVDATVGSASITALDYMVFNSPTLTAGGTITTFNGLNILNITGPTTIRGINSAMANGTFINHTGVAVSAFAGDIHMNNGVSLVLGTAAGNRVELLRSAAGVMRMIGVGGTNNEGLDWDFDTATANNIAVTSSTGASLNINVDEIAFGNGVTADGTNFWQVNFAPPARTYSLGSTDIARRLFSPGGGLTINAANTNCFTDILNEPFIAGGSSIPTNSGNMLIQTAPGIGTNRYGLLITSAPSGGTLNYALRCTAGDARFDGKLQFTGILEADPTTVTGTTHTAADEHVILVDDDTAGSAVTVTLPLAATADAIYRIKKLGSTANVTVDGNGAELIDDALTAVLTVQYESIDVASDGTAWWVL